MTATTHSAGICPACIATPRLAAQAGGQRERRITGNPAPGICAVLALLLLYSTPTSAEAHGPYSVARQSDPESTWSGDWSPQPQSEPGSAGPGVLGIDSVSGALLIRNDEIGLDNSPLYLAAAGEDEKGYIEAEELIELFSAEPTMTRSIRGIGGVTAGHAEVRKEFQNILFDFDSDRIRQSSYPQLQEIGEALGVLMRRYPDYSFSIEGHTDSTGDNDYNVHLSRRRAGAVKSYLVSRFGLESRRITAVGFGEDMPVASNETERGRSRNRRVEVVRK